MYSCCQLATRLSPPPSLLRYSSGQLRVTNPCRVLPRVIPDLALEQLAVGEDDLLARFAAHAGRLEADVLYFPAIVLHGDRVADHEGLVDDDCDRREQIAKNVLNGERHGETTDAKSGEQRSDFDLVH